MRKLNWTEAKSDKRKWAKTGDSNRFNWHNLCTARCGSNSGGGRFVKDTSGRTSSGWGEEQPNPSRVTQIAANTLAGWAGSAKNWNWVDNLKRKRQQQNPRLAGWMVEAAADVGHVACLLKSFYKALLMARAGLGADRAGQGSCQASKAY